MMEKEALWNARNLDWTGKGVWEDGVNATHYPSIKSDHNTMPTQVQWIYNLFIVGRIFVTYRFNNH